MTEQKWLACTDPQPMLEFLEGKASDRKLRLFACACCRRVRKSLWSGETGRTAILTAERFADGLINLAEMNLARCDILGQLELYPGEPVYDPSYWMCSENIREHAVWASHYAANIATASISEAAEDFDKRCEDHRDEESLAQANLLRDIFGNPFRPIAIDQSCLTWNDGVVRKVAQRIYEGRNFDDMPILADCLEESGCTNTDILSHCRGSGPHVRGCWLVDKILGKE